MYFNIYVFIYLCRVLVATWVTLHFLRPLGESLVVALELSYATWDLVP